MRKSSSFLFALLLALLSGSQAPAQKITQRHVQSEIYDRSTAKWRSQPLTLLPEESKYSVYASVELGPYGIVLPRDAVGMPKTPSPPIAEKVMEVFNFPSLDVVYSGVARLVPKRAQQPSGELKLKTYLLEQEAQIVLIPLDHEQRELELWGEIIVAGERIKTSRLSILGLFPYESATEQRGNIVRSIIQSSGTFAPLATGYEPLVRGLGVLFDNVFKARLVTTQQSFIANESTFGWYARRGEKESIDGLQYNTVLLQVTKDVSYIKARVRLRCEWQDLPSTSDVFESTIKIFPQEPAEIPLSQLSLTKKFEDLPIILSEVQVAAILKADVDHVRKLIQAGSLKRMGGGITRQSLEDHIKQ
jgi:hypothetical protein